MIVIRDVTLRRGTKVVLERTSATLHPGDKVGLVGRNGSGKSSLFALLAGRLHADAGDVELPSSWRLGEVAQSMPETDQPACEFVLDGDNGLREAQARVVAADALGDGHAIGEAHLALEHAGGFDARPRAQSLLLGLGFEPDQVEAPLATLSGGWRMRAQLARALMCPADLLLLDEPTNHLDLDALVWLESWLKRYEGTMVVISHDREFLDAVTNVTVHIDAGRLVILTSRFGVGDYPRGLAVESEAANGTRMTLFSGSFLPALIAGLATGSASAPAVLDLPSNRSRALWVRQTGRSERWQWAVHDMRVYRRRAR